MKEIYPNIFQKIIKYEDRHASPQSVYIIRQPKRSLMIDTSYRFEYAWMEIQNMLFELDIDYKDLDIFITHSHPDHVGYVNELADLGARIYMNPEEGEEKADLCRCYLSTDTEGGLNLRSLGITKENYPDDYDELVVNLSRKLVERKEPRTFPFLPIYPGDYLEYEDYRFEVVDLKGHSEGQCGLYEGAHKLLFSGDQILKKIVPIVQSQKMDLNLLSHYIESLEEIKIKYKGCKIFPCHFEMIENPEEDAERILASYKGRCTSIYNILLESGQWMVTRDIGVKSFGKGYMATNYEYITFCMLIWAKTFSCLEYLYTNGCIDRKEENGIIYWRSKKR